MNRWKNGTLQRIRNADEFSLRIVEELELDVIHPRTGEIFPKPKTLDEKANFLNQRNLLRPRGGLWDRTGVRRVLLRVEKIRKEKK
jgi:hypothetical protein